MVPIRLLVECERKRSHDDDVIIREELERVMTFLNAVSKYIHRPAQDIRTVGSAALGTAAVEEMPRRRRHAPPRRFLRFQRSVFILAIVSVVMVTGCRENSEVKEKPEGHIVITDDEILFALPHESIEEPYTAVSSAPIDANTFDNSFSDIGTETESVLEGGLSSSDGNGDDMTTSESTDDQSLFSLQVGAFIFDRNLETQAKELDEHGFTYYVDETERVVLMFCPIIKEELTKKNAEAFMEQFPADVVDPVMIPTDEERFDVTAGLFYYREDAEMITGRLENMGYYPKIEERTVEVVIKRLRVGYYEEIELAKKDSRFLENLGYDPIIVKVQK